MKSHKHNPCAKKKRLINRHQRTEAGAKCKFRPSLSFACYSTNRIYLLSSSFSHAASCTHTHKSATACSSSVTGGSVGAMRMLRSAGSLP